MPKTELSLWNKRMLQLMHTAIQEKVVKTKGEWCKAIGIKQSNLVHIASGARSYTIEQLLAAAKLMNKNMDWFFDVPASKINGLDLIKEGVRMLEENKVKIKPTKK